jgi:hypothetical protein
MTMSISEHFDFLSSKETTNYQLIQVKGVKKYPVIARIAF